jgi:hypothetical protein
MIQQLLLGTLDEVCSLTYCLIQSSEGLLAVPLIPTEQIFANSIFCIILLFQGHLNVLHIGKWNANDNLFPLVK